MNSNRLPDVAVGRRTLLSAFVAASLGTGVASADPQSSLHHVTPDDVTHRATSDGEWNERGTWEGGTIPSAGAVVVIDENVTVTVSHRVDERLQSVHVNGTLAFDPQSNTKLRADTIVGAASSRIEVGTEHTPIAASASAEIEFVTEIPLDRENDPDQHGRGMLTMGECAFHGAEKTSWSSLAHHATAGDEAIELSAEPVGWDEGDTIALPGQRPYDEESYPEFEDHEDELREIVDIDGPVVHFADPLEHDHTPPSGHDLDSYVLNLTRNITITSESSDPREYGHVMHMGDAVATFRYVETDAVGRTDKRIDPSNPLWGRGASRTPRYENPRGRYAIHFHRTGPTADEPHVVTGCVIKDNPGWGVVNHSSFVEMEENVSYDIAGAAFVAEAGNEVGTMKRNFALRSTGSGENTESRSGWNNAKANLQVDHPDDFGHGGHGFWSQSGLIEMDDNIAAGHRHSAFDFYKRSLYEAELPAGAALDGKHDMFPLIDASLLTEFERIYARFGDERPPVGDGWHEEDRSKVFSDSLPIRSFEGNVAFGCGAGAHFTNVSLRNQQSFVDRQVHEDFTAYHIGPLILHDGRAQGQFSDFEGSGDVGMTFRYSGNMFMENQTLIGNGSGIAVYNNFSYINDFHIGNSTIENWGIGVFPARHEPPPSWNSVTNTTLDNDIDIQIPGRFNTPDNALLLDGNTYEGDTTLYWDELAIPVLSGYRVMMPHSGVQFEGHTVYHGWSRPEFVIFPEDDRDRFDRVMNTWGYTWADVLGIDESQLEDALLGRTVASLYHEFGVTPFGGILDPDAEGATRPPGFDGSGGRYDSTPFLGPEDKAQPTDEIWIDALDYDDIEGDTEHVWHGKEGIERGDPLAMAANTEAIQLNRIQHWDDAPHPNAGKVKYTFELEHPDIETDQAGSYHVFLRSQIGEDGGGNVHQQGRFALKIDDGDWKLWDGKGGDFADQNEVGGRLGRGGISSDGEFKWNAGMWPVYELEEGEHTLWIAGKGNGMRLDQLLIKHETVAATPIGGGEFSTLVEDDPGSDEEGGDEQDPDDDEQEDDEEGSDEGRGDEDPDHDDQSGDDEPDHDDDSSIPGFGAVAAIGGIGSSLAYYLIRRGTDTEEGRTGDR